MERPRALFMKVGSSSSTSGTRKSQGPKKADAGFRLDAPEAAGRAAPAAAASAAAGVTAVGAILALQDATSAEARPRALRKGRRLLDALDRLQLALLGDGPTTGHLALLKRALEEERAPTGDASLDEVLNWAEVRVAVEAAKLERAGQAG